MTGNPLLFLSRTGFRQVTAADLTNFPNLTGPITSTGTVTAIGSQTGTGSTFVMQNSPTLTTPNLGVATGTSLVLSGQLSAGSVVTTGSIEALEFSTDSGTTNWKLGTHSTGVLTAAGSVGITINGTTYRLLTST